MRILLTNDDGIQAPGLRALRPELSGLGEVAVVAPATEQSGVAHSITILSPLIIKPEVDADGGAIGWAVEGSPADCVKLGLMELLDGPADLVVSGINSGANAGINVLYSGTVAAAVEGAFFGITAVAVSLQYAEHQDFPRAAALAHRVIEQIVRRRPPPGSLFNVNLPDLARGEPRGVRVVPMGVVRYADRFERRTDPRGRTYYWLSAEPGPGQLSGETDVTSLADGYITVTPLKFNLTHVDHLHQWSKYAWEW